MNFLISLDRKAEMNNLIGDKLKAIRIYKGLSLNALSVAFNRSQPDGFRVDRSYFAKIESGQIASPGSLIIHRLALFFEVTEDYFFSSDSPEVMYKLMKMRPSYRRFADLEEDVNLSIATLISGLSTAK